jgi:hypothetical protein
MAWLGEELPEKEQKTRGKTPPIFLNVRQKWRQ